MIRTRFAPSPTGYLHIGGARTALFSWAYARKLGGKFVLRIEDTDLERSTQQSVQAILDGMHWLGLEWDEDPFFQMQRLARYHEVAEQLLRNGHAYRCYASRAELDAMREAQRLRGEKPRYDGRWRPESGKTLPQPPTGVEPVLRFKNPLVGEVSFDDLVKGRIAVRNSELDDVVLLRADGVPTYNFGVVVDDLDMAITHVIRGDDHVNNTPRQINILKALAAPLPEYAHVPMILGADGERLSKRHGAVSVMQYAQDGYLPEAMVNYLARLGWSHGNEEVFTRAQLVEWFDLRHISRSPAQFNPDKLLWLNQQYLKSADDLRLSELVVARIDACAMKSDDPALLRAIALYKDRVATVNDLALAVKALLADVEPDPQLVREHVKEEALAALAHLRVALAGVEWRRETIGKALKEVVAQRGIKLPQLAIPLRVVLLGQTQTPAIDAVLEALGRERVLSRLERCSAAVKR